MPRTSDPFIQLLTSLFAQLHAPERESDGLLEPQGLVKSFDALGNHPENMIHFLDTVVLSRLEALGRDTFYPAIRSRAHTVLSELWDEGREFHGLHRATYDQHYLSLAFVRAFVDARKCYLNGASNYAEAMRLVGEGHNVLFVQNHSSVLDTFITFSAIENRFGSEVGEFIAFLMSQVFEYVRIINLMTSGANKFKVFQPKHLERMTAPKGAGEEEAAYRQRLADAAQMQRQNAVTLVALRNYCENGGRTVFFYPERDRNKVMGAPEPRYLTMLKALTPGAEAQTQGRKLYVVPLHTCGRNPVVPNMPGPSEGDTIFERIQVGYGDATCGKPVPFEHIAHVVDTIDQRKVVESILGKGKAPAQTELLRQTAIGTAFLSMVAAQCRNVEDTGVYNCRAAETLAERCMQ